uniref:FAT domain-containing protein n=1 Tax=Trichuris muris TaxID=70415 RepID=A0A5S6QC99_TRIMR
MLSEEFFSNLVDLNLHTGLSDVLVSASSNEPDEDAIRAHLELLTIVFSFLPVDRIVSADYSTVVVEYFSFLQDVLVLVLSHGIAQKETISHALDYFLLNGSHTALRNCGKHVIKTLVDAVRGLEPPVAIDASTYRYIGKARNAWHTCAVILKQMTSHCGPSPMQTVVPFCNKEELEVLDAFSNLLSTLGEADLNTAVWLRKSADEELRHGMLWDQHQLYQRSRDHYVNLSAPWFVTADNWLQHALLQTLNLRQQSLAAHSKDIERRILDHQEMHKHFYCACEQLGDWNSVLMSSLCPPRNPMQTLESCWRIGDMENMQSSFATVR